MQFLLYKVKEMLNELPKERIIFEQEYDPETEMRFSDEPYTVEYDEDEKVYRIEGPRIEKMLGYTNLESEKGFTFFQNFMKDNGILDELRNLGINDGDTVRIYGHAFEFYE